MNGKGQAMTRGSTLNSGEARSAFPFSRRPSVIGILRMLLTGRAGYGKSKGSSENGAPFVQRPRMLDSQSRDKGSSPLGGANYEQAREINILRACFYLWRSPAARGGWQELAEKAEITKEAIVEQCRRIVFANLKDAVSWDG